MIDWLDDHSGAVTALATLALVAITAVYVYLTGKLAKADTLALQVAREANDLTRQALVAQTDERNRRQAGQIAAWLPSGWSSSGDTVHFVVRYLNSSPQPAFACDFVLTFPTWPKASKTLDTMPPNEGIRFLEIDVPIPGEGDTVEQPVLEFSFTDAPGRRWHRASAGELDRDVIRQGDMPDSILLSDPDTIILGREPEEL